MKKYIINLYVTILLLLLPSASYATLINVSDSLVYDNSTSQYWYRIISDFNYMQTGSAPVGNALNWISNNNFGLNTWHLASTSELFTMLNNTTAQDFSNHFMPTGQIDASSSHPDLGPGSYAYFIGATNSYDSETYCPLDVFIVRLNFSDPNLFYGVGDGPQWCIGREIGVWVTANGPAPSPVPEPCTALLFGVGLSAFAGFRMLKKS